MEVLTRATQSLPYHVGSLSFSRSSPQGKSLSFSSSRGAAFLETRVRNLRLSQSRDGAGGCRCSSVAVPDAVASTPDTLYGVLGVGNDGSMSEIKSAYRQMARRYHPDVCPANERDDCTQKFLEVQRAYEILSDPEKKADYDYSLLHPLFAQAFQMGAGSGMRRTRGSDGVSDAWKIQWEAQLSRLRHRGDTDPSVMSSSWGSRMRRQTQEQ